MLTDILVALWAIYGAAYFLCFKDRTEDLSNRTYWYCVHPGEPMPVPQPEPSPRPKHPSRRIDLEN